MRALVQRVREGSVAIAGEVRARIGRGYVVLLGIRRGDTTAGAEALAEKCVALRVLEDANGKMNLSLPEAGGSILVVSQFTLYADTRRGNRPGFSEAAGSGEAEPLYEQFVERLRSLLGRDRVATGVFGAMMDVTIVNDGPVTILLESPDDIHP